MLMFVFCTCDYHNYHNYSVIVMNCLINKYSQFSTTCNSALRKGQYYSYYVRDHYTKEEMNTHVWPAFATLTSGWSPVAS